MPKVSFASKDAYEPKIGITEGWVEIVGARTEVYQYPPSRETGETSPVFLGAVIDFQRTDEKGEPLEEEPTDKVIRIEKDLTKMRPGKASSRDDQDPEDMGDELGTVGNCIYTEESKVNINSGWMQFNKSLEDKGFKSEILGQGYLPDLIGVKGHVITVKGEKRSINGRDIEPNYIIFDKLTVRPYEQTGKAGKKPAASAKANGAAHTEANGVPAAPAKPVKAGKVEAADGAVEEAATSILVGIISELDGETRESGKFFAMAFSRLMKDKNRNKALDKPVQDLLKSEEWLQSKAAEMEGVFSFSDGVISFGSAAAAAAA